MTDEARMADDGCTQEPRNRWHGAMRYPMANLTGSIAWIDAWDAVDELHGFKRPCRVIAEIGNHVVFGLAEGGYDGVFIATEDVVL